ncbi:MAG: hypothetical protein CSA53_05245 [Gammaproteobacteria bacterium]|nr:MAG: hypothetical protein CSA53_05245 [Gammaproteobacteria bacterium]
MFRPEVIYYPEIGFLSAIIKRSVCKLVLSIFSIALLLPLAAQADQTYIAVGALYSSIDGEYTYQINVEGFAKEHFDDKGYGWHLALGHEFNDLLSLELSYQDFGKAKREYLDDYSASIESLAASALLSRRLTGYLSAHIKAGFEYWRVSEELVAFMSPLALYIVNPSFNNKGSGTDPFFGVGVGYTGILGLDLIAEYTLHKFDDIEMDTLSLSVRLRF